MGVNAQIEGLAVTELSPVNPCYCQKKMGKVICHFHIREKLTVLHYRESSAFYTGGSELRTSSVFEWSKKVHLSNGSLFRSWLE